MNLLVWLIISMFLGIVAMIVYEIHWDNKEERL